MLTEENWRRIAEVWYDEFIRRKERCGCGDIRREIEECFVDFIQEEYCEIDQKEAETVTEMALFWFDEKLIT